MSGYRSTFISHAHANNVICAQYAAALQGRGLDLWIDLTNMQDGHSLSSDITYELFRRQAFVVMLTAASNASHWVGQELETYQNWANDRRYRLAEGAERLIVPVLLDADLPMVVVDSETRRERASNWAKLFRLKAIDGVGRPVDQVALEVLRALAIATPAPVVTPQQSGSPPPPPRRPYDLAPTPARLAQLGFGGRRYNGVECLVPPTVPVAAGQFLMGSDKTKDPQADDAETPQYLIHVDQFAMGTYPVTVAEYALYLRANPSVAVPPDLTFEKDWNWVAPEWRGKTLTWAIQQQQRFDHPVVLVSWEDARNYAAWLAKVTRDPWRLPTEAEREKAARGTDGRIYPWGNTWDARRANTQDGGPKLTTPIGQYADRGDASPYGCHDMAGNVWEWCSSYYKPYPYDKQNSEQPDYHSNNHVIRGGSWRLDPRNARAACRGSGRYDGSGNLGFRLACAGPGPG